MKKIVVNDKWIIMNNFIGHIGMKNEAVNVNDKDAPRLL